MFFEDNLLFVISGIALFSLLNFYCLLQKINFSLLENGSKKTIYNLETGSPSLVCMGGLKLLGVTPLG